MKKHLHFYFLLVCLFFSQDLTAQSSTDTMKTYIFGHSLINHAIPAIPTPSQETSVPHWFQDMAQAANRPYAVAGQYGFLPQHATLPTTSQWGFDSVAGAWDQDTQLFSEADFDNILITPGNFIQYQAPFVNYFNDTQSPLDYTSQILNWCIQQEDSLVFYVYENWPDLAPFQSNGFPASASEWNNYNTYLNGNFHDWFLEYHDSLILAHPQHCVRMIPVGPVISHILGMPPYNQIPIDTLYEDDAPHGRPSIYFLAAMVTYMAMHETPAPSNYQVPSIIDPIIANNYNALVGIIWAQLENFRDSVGDSRVFCNSPIMDIDANNGEAIDWLLEEENLLQLYPNPFRNSLHIDGNLSDCEISILDLTGREWQILLDSRGNLDFSLLPLGLYLIRILNRETGRVEQFKVLKQN